MPVEWNAPRPKRQDFVPIVRPGIAPIRLMLLGKAECLNTHWDSERKRSTPCLGASCPSCREGIPKRWHAYYPAYQEVKPPKPIILDVTAEAAAQIEGRSSDGPRGLCIEVQRQRSSPVRVAFPETHFWDKFKLPERFDVRTLLLHIFGVNDNAEELPQDAIAGRVHDRAQDKPAEIGKAIAE